MLLSLNPWGGAEDVDEEEVGGQDGGQVPDELVRGGRDLEGAKNIETSIFASCYCRVEKVIQNYYLQNQAE